jgi:hypothetical protein
MHYNFIQILSLDLLTQKYEEELEKTLGLLKITDVRISNINAFVRVTPETMGVNVVCNFTTLAKFIRVDFNSGDEFADPNWAAMRLGALEVVDGKQHKFIIHNTRMVEKPHASVRDIVTGIVTQNEDGTYAPARVCLIYVDSEEVSKADLTELKKIEEHASYLCAKGVVCAIKFI